MAQSRKFGIKRGYKGQITNVKKIVPIWNLIVRVKGVWEGLLVVTDVSTSWPEVIFRVSSDFRLGRWNVNHYRQPFINPFHPHDQIPSRYVTPRVKPFSIISNGNRTEWSPIRSVIIRVITKSDDRTDRIGRHEVLLPINHKNYNFREKKSSQVMWQREILH